jgi:Glycosyl hydrolase 2 galactose-binding domain-like/Exo-beta-D-glucosaminidase Ig-fold domain/Glycosyl hydrolases family 2/NedA-like, galactose-binding domain
MSTSRRTFLKNTIAGASVALGELHAFAEAPGAALDAHPANVSAEPPAKAAPPDGTPVYTRGIGVYPGEPSEDFAPSLVPDTSNTYRNLALHRPAYHSSSYDYNLTAQLVTDGIKHTELPRWVATSVSFRGLLPKTDREFFLDHNPTSVVELRGARPYVDIQLGGGAGAPVVDRIEVLVVKPREVNREDLTITVSVSDDGRAWNQAGSATAPESSSLAGYPPGFAQPGQLFRPSVPLNAPAHSRFYRVGFEAAHAPGFAFGMQWQVGEAAFFNGAERIEIGGPYSFTSAWMSEGLGNEWVYVDLGAGCEFDRVALHWIARAAEGSIQVSDDAQTWRDLQPLPAASGAADDIKLAQTARGRYVRVLMTRPSSPDGYILSEIEVYGRGGFIAQPKPAAAPREDGRLDLAGGAWRLQRDSLVAADGTALSKAGFRDDDWVPATVPGTVLTSYLNIGAIPDPNYGDNQLQISDSYFYADFWYRNEFTAPEIPSGERAWLNFDGINWKADVYLNGESLGRIEGGFMRGRFDVTGKLIPAAKNAIAVRVEKNATPGSVKQKTFETAGKNGGALGADNPTYHASIGWDWISTIRGRNTGIWDNVFLTRSGPVTIENPFVTTVLPLPDTSRADVNISLDLINHDARPVTGTLRVGFGDLQLEQHVTVDGLATKSVTLSPSTHPQLRIQNPALWWPVGYGEPKLHNIRLSFERAGGVSSVREFQAGLRQMTYSEEGGALKIWVNGRRFVARGGNWGFGESMLRYRAREFDAALRYHREMNFTMIRNWVGQIGEDELYEACDRHGIMVWQDFWLANPWDGPEPNDDALFMTNVKDVVLRIRNHPCMGLYCGRNEGFPPKPLEDGIRQVLTAFHPDLHYVPSSADNTVSGHGPYSAMPIAFYFGFGADPKLHSEMGAPNIPPIESVRVMMPASATWPQGLDWGLHDFCLQGAANGASYLNMIENAYGGATSLEEWVQLAQFINYDIYRAMFEAQSKYRMGLLLWMSHPCWPSFVWQTYDYYFEPTAAYFGCKKGSEPLHIQWNPVTESIEVVNYSGGNARGLTASVEVLNMDGTRKWQKSELLDSAEDSVTAPIKMDYPSGLSPVHFLRLSLYRGDEPVSTNFYLRGLQQDNFRALRLLPQVNLTAATRTGRRGTIWQLTTDLSNASDEPALMVRLKAVRSTSGDRILPAIYSDNYIALVPGERRTIQTELRDADTRGEAPRIAVDGFNVTPLTGA